MAVENLESLVLRWASASSTTADVLGGRKTVHNSRSGGRRLGGLFSLSFARQP